MEDKEIVTEIANIKKIWTRRQVKFREWYETLNLVDKLEKKGLESACSSKPMNFYKLSHYLLTAGEVYHSIPIENETPTELDNQALCERACRYMWRSIDRKRMQGGKPSFLSELVFQILALGWYSFVLYYDEKSMLPKPILWSPAEVFPKYDDEELVKCVHEYTISVEDALKKVAENNWKWSTMLKTGRVTLDNYFYREGEKMKNIVLIDNKKASDEMTLDGKLYVAPVAGFPDEGAILGEKDLEWAARVGQSILEPGLHAGKERNRWMTFLMQRLHDTVNPMYQEQSTGEPKVKDEDLTRRNALFHFAPGEGLSEVQRQAVPGEIAAILEELHDEEQKSGFSDALYGIVEKGMSGYAYSQVSATANRVLDPYDQSKNFVIEEIDKFFLENVKKGGKTFKIRGKTMEELKPEDIPEDIYITVESELATPKDWLEKSTIANYLKEMVDETTLLSEVLNFPDTQAILRRKKTDAATKHPMTLNIELIAAWRNHADYLEFQGTPESKRTAQLFRRAADAMEAQFGLPAPGQAKPTDAGRVEAQRKAGAPGAKVSVPSQVLPPEESQGFTPAEQAEVGRV